MALYLSNTGKIFFGALAAYAASKIYAKHVESQPVPVAAREKMTAEWKAAVEAAFCRGDVRGFAALFRSINPAISEDDILRCWDIMRR
jgi:hypothetical protein